MLYAFYQHPVSQARIVSDVYGSPQNIPAMSGFTIARELNRCWTDDTGATFDSTVTAAYDYQAGINNLTNQQVIAELDGNRPLVIGARTHAMVLTALQYYQTPSGPNVVAAGVFDPWPGIGARSLQMDELVPIQLGGSLRFLASVRTTERSSACATTQPPPQYEPATGCSTSGSGNLALASAAVALLSFRRRRKLPYAKRPDDR